MRTGRTFLQRAVARFWRERDLSNWRGVLAPLRLAHRAPARRTALFCDLMTTTSTAKLESLIAGLLRLQGYRAIVLLERPDRATERRRRYSLRRHRHA